MPTLTPASLAVYKSIRYLKMDSEIRDIVFLGLKDVRGKYRPPWYTYILLVLIAPVFLALGIFLLIAAFNREAEVLNLLCSGFVFFFAWSIFYQLAEFKNCNY